MRVGFDVRQLVPPAPEKTAGIGTYSFNLLNEIARQKPNWELVLFFHHEPGNSMKKFMSERNIRSVVIPGSRFMRNRLIWNHFLLANALKKEKIKLFHGLQGSIPLTCDCRAVVTIHNIQSKDSSNGFVPFLERKINGLANRAKASRFIAVSEAVKRDLVESKVDSEKIETIMHGCNEFGQTKKVLPGLVDKKFVLYVGTITLRKNIGLLLEAFANISQEFPKLLLVLAGKDLGQRQQLKFKAEQLGISEKIRFLEFVSRAELSALYTQAEFLAFPSLHEGFGLPVLEAMKCGCPVVSVRSGAVQDFGQDAVLFTENNIESFSQGLGQLVRDKDLRKSLSRKAMARAKLFSWANSAASTIRLYGEIMKQ